LVQMQCPIHWGNQESSNLGSRTISNWSSWIATSKSVKECQYQWK
jgi:hypothetical protein